MIDLEKQKEIDENVRKTFNRFKREAIKKYGVSWETESKAKLVNVLYSKVLDSEKFKDGQQYKFCLESDRFDNGKDTALQIKQVIASRLDFVSDTLTLEINREAIKKNKISVEPKEEKTSTLKVKL